MRPIAALALALSCIAQLAQAQLPATRLDGIFPAGAKAGTTVEVTLAGNDLDDATELHFSHPGVTAERKMAEATPFDQEPQPIPNQFVVTVAADVPMGPVDVRVRGKYGLSNPRVFDLSNLAEMNESEPNNEADGAHAVTLPQIVNGQINRSTDVDVVRFTAEAGQRILIDCRARRIDSALKPLLSVSDAKGRELVSSDRNGQAGDAMIDFHVPRDGDYDVRVADAYYRGGAGYVYRLAMGALPHIDFIFPPAGTAGSNQPYTIFGRNLPAGKPSEYRLDGQQLDQLTVNVKLPADPASLPPLQGRIDPEQAFLDVVEYRVQDAITRSNPVCVGIALAPTVLEVEANDTPAQAQQLALPCEVAGRFYPVRDHDWYTFEAKQGDNYSIEVISNRLGLPTDPQLIIHQVTKNDKGDEQVKVLVTADDVGTRVRAQFDTRSGDVAYQFVAPVDATYRLTVRDGFSALRSDPRLVYRLAIRQPQPDFRLVAVPQDPWGALRLRKGDRTTIDVLVERRDGLIEPITVSVTGLPTGVTSEAVTLGPTMSVVSLVLTAGDNAVPAIANLEIVGTARIADHEVKRVARCGTANSSMRILAPNQRPQNSLPARLSREVALTIVEGESPFTVQLNSDKVWETTRAGILKIPYTATRRGDYKGQVQCAVANLPANINPTTFNIANNNAKGEMQLTLRNNTPAGTYTVHAGAYVTAYSYARNPEAAAAAKQRKAAIDKIAAEAVKNEKEKATAKQQSDRAAVETANLAKAAEQKQAQASKAESEAIASQQRADEAFAKAQAALTATPEDAAAKAAVVVAEKAAADAAAKTKTAMTTVVAAAQALQAAQAKATEAAENKVAADQAAEAAKAFAKEAADAKKLSDKQATDTTNAAKAKNINYWTASTPITIKIHEFPITLAELPETTKLKQGDANELPVRITRLIDYQEQVSLTAVIRGVSGLSIKNMNIPKGQTEIKLPMTVSANATPGKHEITLRATMRVNNQTLTLDRPFRLEIEKVEPKP